MAIVPKVGFTQSPELEIDDVRVVGEIPDWVEGTLLRNGPGTFKVGNQRYRHWFDGLAMLHRFSIKSGKVSYSNKLLESLSYSWANYVLGVCNGSLPITFHKSDGGI